MDTVTDPFGAGYLKLIDDGAGGTKVLGIGISSLYRKMDEIGVPYVVTVDFDTLEGDTKDTVTVRTRDTTAQSRAKIINLIALLGKA